MGLPLVILGAFQRKCPQIMEIQIRLRQAVPVPATDLAAVHQLAEAVYVRQIRRSVNDRDTRNDRLCFRRV